MTLDELITRDQFREAVFERDNYRCVNCRAQAVDAHHLLERRLWRDLSGGYYLDNGVSLCKECHMKAESTELSVDILRELAGITKIILPDTLMKGSEYDKWGNEILPTGQRLRGPLFHDPSVQKILVPVLEQFSPYYKFPRIPHLPWSRGVSLDDIQLREWNLFDAMPEELVITEKMDGENITMYRDYIHARSMDSGYHESRTWVKNFWANQVAFQIPETMRIVGENMWATHSLRYDDLSSYFLGFAIFDEGFCLPWNATLEWFELLEIVPVPELARGEQDSDPIRELITTWEDKYGRTKEGYVIRPTREILATAYSARVAKYVREDHVTTDSHWLYGKVEQNGLR